MEPLVIYRNYLKLLKDYLRKYFDCTLSIK